LASSVFYDPQLLTVADLDHSCAVLSVVFLWSEADPAVIEIRLISARKTTQSERWQFEEGL
jgi:uncharacterized DUF497 family protein